MTVSSLRVGQRVLVEYREGGTHSAGTITRIVPTGKAVVALSAARGGAEIVVPMSMLTIR